MKNDIKDLKFPKILIMHKKVEINLNPNEDLFKEKYFLEMLDYNDILLNTKIVYDIYFKQIRITQSQNGLFYPWSSENVFLVIDRIERNTLDTLNVDKGYLLLKLDNDGDNIVIYYTGIADFIGVFGSFYATLSLFASLITSYPAEIIYNQTIINSIFKFVENKFLKDTQKKIKFNESLEKDLKLNSFKFKYFEDLDINQINNIFKRKIDETGYKENNPDKKHNFYKKDDKINLKTKKLYENNLKNQFNYKSEKNIKKEKFIKILIENKKNDFDNNNTTNKKQTANNYNDNISQIELNYLKQMNKTSNFLLNFKFFRRRK
jgi:hypothetical protein